MKVLSLGLPKTGTASLAEAYRILGYQDVHHGMPAVFQSPSDFEVLRRAAGATFPNLPTYTGRPFTRAEWDDVFGPCEVVTDVAAFFAPQLVDVYPEAKVVLCERPRGDVEAWFRSVSTVFDMTFGLVPTFFIEFVEPLVGSSAGPASRAYIKGFFQARDGAEVRANARRRYREHYETLRRIVPKERLLEFELEDGWGPLCAFLGKDVPDVPFPRVNEAAEFKAMWSKWIWMHWASFKRRYGPFIGCAAAVGVAAWAAKGSGLL